MCNQEIIQSKVNRLKQFDHIPPEYIRFFSHLSDAQCESLNLIKNDKISEDIKKFSDKKGGDGESPFLDKQKINFGENYLSDLFNKLIKIMNDFSHENKKELNLFKDAIDHSKLTLNQLVDAFLSGNYRIFTQWESKLSIRKELLFVTRTLIQPILRLFSETFSQNSNELRSANGKCPICDTPPSMARLENDSGRRILWCSLCGAEYYFSRLRCVHCLNENQNELKFFFTDDKSPYRVDVCEKCLNYIKTIDERRIATDNKIFMDIEDTGTADLDILAENEGYQSRNSIFNQ